MHASVCPRQHQHGQQASTSWQETSAAGRPDDMSSKGFRVYQPLCSKSSLGFRSEQVYLPCPIMELSPGGASLCGFGSEASSPCRDDDRMDQSKIRCPRNIAMTKEFESLWRPQLHLSVVVVHGVLEMYLLGDADLLKNSDANLSMISALLRRWRNPVIGAVSLFSILLMSLPSQAWHWTRHLRSWPLVLCACPIVWWCRRTIRRAGSGTNRLGDMVCRGIFESVTQNYFEVGRSHNECDQRFVAVASCLYLAEHCRLRKSLRSA